MVNDCMTKDGGIQNDKTENVGENGDFCMSEHGHNDGRYAFDGTGAGRR